MSWKRTRGWLASACLLWLAVATPLHLAAQTPQLAPPQYGISDGTPSNFTDAGPQPNQAPAASASPAASEDREYLRLLNPAAAPTNTANPTTANPVNVGVRQEPPTDQQPHTQAIYQQPIATNGSPATPLVTNAAGNPGPSNYALPNNSPRQTPSANIPATYLAPASNSTVNNPPRTLNGNSAKPIPLAGPNSKPAAAASSWSSFGTMLGSLAIVLGLFVVTIKLLRRGMPGVKQRLGRDVVEVLGQTPLAPRQTLQVIRFGNKILLVAMSPDGCDTLTEITDPLEVDRLAGMCQQSQAGSSTKTFGEMFRQVTSIRPVVSEPVAEAPPASSTLDEVRARLRGGAVSAREVTHG